MVITKKRKFAKMIFGLLMSAIKIPFKEIISFFGSHMICLPNIKFSLFCQFFSGSFGTEIKNSHSHMTCLHNPSKFPFLDIFSGVLSVKMIFSHGHVILLI
jgi:hypothetical protein